GNWLDQVRCGNAPSPDQAAVAEAIGPQDGRAGSRIAEDLAEGLTRLLRPTMPVPAAPVVTVRAASLGADGVLLDVVGPEGLALRWQDGPRGTQGVPVVDGRALIPARASLLGGPVAPLRSGTYRLLASVPQGRAVVRMGADVWAQHGASWCDSGSRMTLRVLAGDVLDLVVEPPVDRDTESARVVEQATYASSRTQPLMNAVLLSSYQGTAAACSPRAIDAALHAVGHDATRYWLVTDLSVEVPEGGVPVVRGSKEHYEIAATARWLVDNEAMPHWLRKRTGQTLLQTWHGTPLKALRWDLDKVSPREPESMGEADRDAGSWDVVLSPNPHSSEVLRRAFRVQGEVLELGYPRNDVLADPVLRAAAGLRARARLGIDPDAPVVLHAPTWRDGAARRASRDGSWNYGATWQAQPMLDPIGVHEALGEGGVLLYRGHRFVAGTAPEFHLPGVVDVTTYPDMGDLLAAADLLVTDYSSSLFDFALTGRPMVFFAYDLEDYRDRQRGLYFDMETELPGPVVRTTDEVSALVAQHHLLPVAGTPTYDAFVARFAPWDDGRAAERVVQAVFT
ncbi:MAG: CDP-glycerol glycerophosphotransferase family protein, partial [Mycobacteriales bacterium]